VKAWIWIHEAIMREEREIIGKLGVRFLRLVFKYLRVNLWCRGLDFFSAIWGEPLE
jgi:hypothetical protein